MNIMTKTTREILIVREKTITERINDLMLTGNVQEAQRLYQQKQLKKHGECIQLQ